jgi:hypothetical protein
MLRKIFISGLLVALSAMPALADKPYGLDSKSRKIIIDRVCSRYQSKQYTDREIINYAEDLVASNAELIARQEIYADEQLMKDIQLDYNKIADSTNRRIIKKETKSILQAVDRGCW